MEKFWIKKFTGVFLALCLVTLPVSINENFSIFSPPAQAGFFNDELEIFEDVLLLVSKNYVYPPDYERLFQSAIKGLVESVGTDKVELKNKESHQIILKKRNQVIPVSLGPNRDKNFQVFRKVFEQLIKEANGSPSEKELEAASINGIMSALDPYSQYLDEDAFERSMRDTEGQYGGLGMVITMKDYQLTIVKTMKNSPARRAGILTDDIITQVNGKDIKGMQIDELADLLRGYPNTRVTVKIFRSSANKNKLYNLTREIISVETVEYRKMGRLTGYIKITSFSKQTNDQLEEALEKARSDNIKTFVLDLRNNPGGLLDQSVKVASHFMNRGRLVVFTQGREKSDRHEYRALYKNTINRAPVAILINQHSASASEIVAGALRDSGRALIVGENSFGKGSVQTIFRIRDNSGIRLTTSKYYTPSGIDITENGIVPEIQIVNDSTPSDQESLLNQLSNPKKLTGGNASIQLKQSSIKKYLEDHHVTVSEENDPTLLFAQLIVNNSKNANKKHVLEKARELASNILY